ncbi:MAG: hypothetical protein AAB325_01820 [Pseudomonadota bacterium]
MSTTTRTLTPNLSHFYGYFSGGQWSEFLRCSSYGPYLLRKALPRLESARRLDNQCVTAAMHRHGRPKSPQQTARDIQATFRNSNLVHGFT